MKRFLKFFLTSAFIFFVIQNISFAGLRVGYLSPSNPVFETFSNNFLNGLYLGLSKNETVVIQNTSRGVQKALENLYLMGADVIVGPFESQAVKNAKDELCNSGIAAILPFAKPNYSCNDVFVYNYNPISAALELAKVLINGNLGRTLVLYEDDGLDIAKKDAFIEGVQSQNIQLNIKMFEKSASYDDYIKSLFGVWKIRHRKSLTDKPVYRHSLNIDSIVIFAPETDFINISNLLDYYSINVKAIYSNDIIVNNNLLSLSDNILRKMEFVTPYYLCSKDPENVSFVKRYDLEYQNDPSFMSALGYDIGRLLRGADGISLTSRLKQTSDFDGLIGKLLFFDDTGKGFINYKTLTYKDIEKCKAVMLNR